MKKTWMIIAVIVLCVVLLTLLAVWKAPDIVAYFNSFYTIPKSGTWFCEELNATIELNPYGEDTISICEGENVKTYYMLIGYDHSIWISEKRDTAEDLYAILRRVSEKPKVIYIKLCSNDKVYAFLFVSPPIQENLE